MKNKNNLRINEEIEVYNSLEEKLQNTIDELLREEKYRDSMKSFDKIRESDYYEDSYYCEDSYYEDYNYEGEYADEAMLSVIDLHKIDRRQKLGVPVSIFSEIPLKEFDEDEYVLSPLQYTTKMLELAPGFEKNFTKLEVENMCEEVAQEWDVQTFKELDEEYVTNELLEFDEVLEIVILRHLLNVTK